MPTGPDGQERPASVIGAAVKVAQIATGQTSDSGKDPHAVAMGKKGGPARAENLSPERRSEIARKAALARWGRP